MELDINNSTASCVDLKLTNEEMNIFVQIFSSSNTRHTDWLYDFLYYIIGKNRFIKFVDIFAGETFSVPKIEVSLRMMRDAKVYSRFLKEKKKYDEAIPEDEGLHERPSPYAATASVFGLRTEQVFRICARVKASLSKVEDIYQNIEKEEPPKQKRQSKIKKPDSSQLKIETIDQKQLADKIEQFFMNKELDDSLEKNKKSFNIEDDFEIRGKQLPLFR